MTDDRHFPVQSDYRLPKSERDALPASLPWHVVEQWREQIEANHEQTLERLCERGGLSPRELYLGAYRLSLRMIRSTDERSAARWLIAIASAAARPRSPDPLIDGLAAGEAVLLDGSSDVKHSTPITAAFDHDDDSVEIQEWYWSSMSGCWLPDPEARVTLSDSALDKLIAARSRSNAT